MASGWARWGARCNLHPPGTLWFLAEGTGGPGGRSWIHNGFPSLLREDPPAGSTTCGQGRCVAASPQNE